MKNVYTRFIVIPLLALFLAPLAEVKACDRSDIRLDSVVTSPLFTDIYITMHVGGGITGTTKGAENGTRTFAFLFYGNPILAPISYPTTISSDSTKANYPGVNAGPALGSQFAIGYIYQGIDFACVTTTALCGNRHTDTKHLVFRVNQLPDSVRLAGIEGAGNPFAGCYPDADMLIDFTNLPVEWANVEAKASPEGIEVSWATASETNNDYFEIERSLDGESFTALARMEASGTTTGLSSYNYVDANVPAGRYFYRIRQTDLDGTSSHSAVVQAVAAYQQNLGWTSIGPNPFQNNLRAEFTAPKGASATIRLIDLQGTTALNQQVEVVAGVNKVELDGSGLAAGIYFAQVESSGQRIVKRVLKQ